MYVRADVRKQASHADANWRSVSVEQENSHGSVVIVLVVVVVVGKEMEESLSAHSMCTTFSIACPKGNRPVAKSTTGVAIKPRVRQGAPPPPQRPLGGPSTIACSAVTYPGHADKEPTASKGALSLIERIPPFDARLSSHQRLLCAQFWLLTQPPYPTTTSETFRSLTLRPQVQARGKSSGHILSM